MNPNVHHLPIGTLLGGGRYRIVRFIGAGGFGCTYEAEFVPMHTRVAIKEFFVSSYCNRDATGAISLGASSQAGLVAKLEEKFASEAKRLFKLKHPGIVSVTDILKENGTSYYVMDYIAGSSLQSLINHQGPLPEARALRYIGQVMDALEYVHGKNMLHLDIKPDNIMIDAETDRAILIDFGVSKQYDEIDGHNTSTIMGQTPGYAPPEQADNSLQNFTPAADIYALGATLYTALTGIVPASSPKLISGSAHLAPLPAGTSASTKNAIGAMMQPAVKRRPQTVAAARALLAAAPAAGVETAPLTPVNVGIQPGETQVGTRHVASTSADANHTKPLAPAAAPATKSKKWLWAAIAVAAIAIGAAVYFLSSFGKSAPEEPLIALADTTTVSEQSNELDQLDESDSSEHSDNSDSSDYSDNPTPVPTPAPTPTSATTPPPTSTHTTAPTTHPAPVNTPEPTPTPTAPTSGYVQGHQWLDMGTSVKWATTNIGASSPKDNGLYFGWGEISMIEEYTESQSQTYGQDIGSIAGRLDYDAARYNWKGRWRMPTQTELQELIEKCEWEWYGSGMKVTAKNGNVLYLPAAGFQYGSSLFYVGESGRYWSATPNGSLDVWFLDFYSGGQIVKYNYRMFGHSIRPVLD